MESEPSCPAQPHCDTLYLLSVEKLTTLHLTVQITVWTVVYPDVSSFTTTTEASVGFYLDIKQKQQHSMLRSVVDA